MSTDKLWTVISGIEYQLNILKDKLKTFDEETNQSVDEAYQRGLEEGKKAFDLLDAERNSEYKRGFEDGKAIHEKGCEGCEYTVMGSDTAICSQCCNAYHNQWTANKIEVGDEVVWTEDEDVVIVVTCVNTTNGFEWCDGVCRDGKVYQILTEHARKTGRHFDIASILEDMRCGQ